MRKKPAALTRRNADRHALYEIAVQRPEVVVGFIEELAALALECDVTVLREDFCGTANLASHWAASGSHRRAVGVDSDAEVLAWAEQHNRRPIGDAAKRLRLVEADVMKCRAKADAIASLNFSPWVYHDRPSMLAYLKHARRCLNPGGLLLLDAFGGPGSIVPSLDQRCFAEFDYQWQQVSFDPITHRIVCHIHFKFANGSTLRQAFVYDWRMWTLPELRDLLLEAGFAQVDIYFESEEGFIHEVEADEVAQCDSWVAYLVAIRD
jgi:SAM-dependent methyltransferase